eukprot:gene16675-18367_t
MERCVVKTLYDFEKEADTDLKLCIGDIVKVTEKVNDDWYIGVKGSETGQFPAAFAELVLEGNPTKVFVAVADFTGQLNDDISFVKGDIIGFEEDIDENWFTGRTLKSHGLCPKSFVEEIHFKEEGGNIKLVEGSADKNTNDVRKAESPYGTSVDAFNAQGSDELSFPKGVKIELTKEIDSFWTEGIYNGQKGKFPSLFVEVITPLPDALRCKDSNEGNDVTKEALIPNAKALFMYIAVSSDELSFDKGDTIVLTERVNSEWLKGKIGNTEGMFPASYVKVIVDLPFKEKTLSNGSLQRIPHSISEPKSQRKPPPVVRKAQGPRESHSEGKKPALKPKPSLKEKPVMQKQPKPSQPSRSGPLLLTSRKNQSKGSVEGRMEPAVSETVADDSSLQGCSSLQAPMQSQSKRPTVIRSSKQPVKPSSPKPPDLQAKSKSVVTEQGKQSPKLQQKISNSDGPKPQARSSSRQLPAKQVTIEHNMPLLQTTTAKNSKANRPPRPASCHPSPNTKLLEQELSSVGIDMAPRENVEPKSVFYTSENFSNKSVDQDKPTAPPRKAAPKRPSHGPSRTVLPKATNATQATSPTLGPRVDPQRPDAVTTMSKRQPRDQRAADKSKTLPPRLPKPLAPMPPVKPAMPRSPGTMSTDSVVPTRIKPGHPNSPLSPKSTAILQPTTNGRFYVPTAITDRQEEPSKEMTQTAVKNSQFYVDDLTPDSVDGGENNEKFQLESVEERIVQIKGQIMSEANMLSGIETLLEVSDDDSKKNELLSKKRSLSASLLNLDDELNAYQDEKSCLLAVSGDVAAIRARIKELSDLIDDYQDNSRKLRKMKEIASIDELEDIRDGIEFFDNMTEDLLEEITSLKTQVEKLEPVVEEPVKVDPAETRRNLLHHRQKAIEELIKTERDYVRDMDLCSTKILNLLRDSKAIDCDVLFGNLTSITEVSKKLLEVLLQLEQDQEISAAKHIGQCFSDLAFDLKSEYSCYCRNYDESQVLLEKLEQDPERREEIVAAVTIVREETGLWDLSSYLIKPVQRILKYPLILQEVFKYSPEDDEDRSLIHDAINILKNVANTINEFKRRKDLVQKYQREEEGIGDKIQRLNWHSVRKKTSRINQKITQFTGLVSQTVDEAFNEEERRFKSLEKMVKSFVRNLSLYLEYFREDCNLQKIFAEDVRVFCNEASNKDEIESLCNFMSRIRDTLCPDFMQFVKARVFNPLERLLLLFQSPARLIEKRHDKCLDYDRMLNRAQKMKEKDKLKQANDELTMSRKIYEALNSQLLEELPRFSQKCLKFFDFCLANLVQARCSYLQKITEELKLCLQFHLIERYSFAEILQKHEEALTVAEERLLQLIFTPERSFSAVPTDGPTKSESMTLPRDQPVSNFYVDLMDEHHEVDPTSPIKPSSSSGEEKTDEMGAGLEKPRPKPRKMSLRKSSASSGSPASPQKSPRVFNYESEFKAPFAPSGNPCWYMVEFSFEREDDAEMSVEEGTIVNVLRKHDKEGNSEWWLIEASPSSRGYVPALYLNPLNMAGCEAISHVASDVIDANGSRNGETQIQSVAKTDASSVTKEGVVADKCSSDEGFSSPSFDVHCHTAADSREVSVQLYRAVYDFDASEPGECSMPEGATVRLIRMGDDSENMEWSQVEWNGQTGYVPSNYIEPVDGMNNDILDIDFPNHDIVEDSTTIYDAVIHANHFPVTGFCCAKVQETMEMDPEDKEEPQLRFLGPRRVSKRGKAKLNICGTRFEARWSTFLKFPQTRLGMLAAIVCGDNPNGHVLDFCDDYDHITNEFFFERNATAFPSILNYYISKHLHIPRSDCVKTFEEEVSKRQFLKGAQNAVDLLAIFPFYIGLIIDFSTSDGVSSNFENIRRFVQILRIIRIVRIFKLARHSTGLQVLAYTVKESSEELGLLVLLLLMGMTLFSTLIYYAEQNVPGTKFKSIIEGFWWAIITMTTIGYGDIYPDTTYGKMIGCMCCISGILFIALPIPTIVGNFSKYYREHRNKEKMDMNKTNAVDVADEFDPYFVIALDRARRISSYSARRSTIAKPITMQQKTEHLDTIIA